MKEEKKSVIKEALTEYNEILEAASANAKKKLADEFPEKFTQLLGEELSNKNKNKSAKESYKKIDEAKESKILDDTEQNKESVMKNQKEETKKIVKEKAREDNTSVNNAKKDEIVDEAVTITDTVGDGKPFKKSPAKSKKIEEGFENEEPIEDSPDEFDLTELDISSVGSALENANDDDEVFSYDELENEISEMEELSERMTDFTNDSSPTFEPKNNGGIAYDKLVNMKNEIDEMISNLGVDEQIKNGGKQTFPRPMGNYSREMIDEDHLTDSKSKKEFIANTINTMNDDAFIDKIYKDIEGKLGSIKEEEDEELPITDADIDAVLGSDVDEGLGITHAKRKNVTATLNPDHYPERRRYAYNENEVKFNKLLEENKKLTKRINENKKYKQSVGTLVEQYKSALEKYRNQLKEMAIFNTNLAHVNNLLVNEELALTQEDKVTIINEFKKVNTITESQDRYKSILSEMKENKKTLSESIEDKVSVSIQPSSKQKLDEVVEKTAYENSTHINKMKKLIGYMDKRGKK